MFGTKDSLLGKDEGGLGLMPRAILNVLQKMEQSDQYETILRASIVELYMGYPQDLLNKAKKSMGKKEALFKGLR